MAHREDPEDPSWSPPAGRPVRASWLITGGLCALVLIMISFYYTGQWHDARSGNRLLVAVAGTVADAHLRPRPLDIESPDLEIVLAYFDTGDAGPVRKSLAGRDQTLIGGRSMSIEGYPAIQLRFQSVDGHAVTRYVAAIPARQQSGLPGPAVAEAPPQTLIRGVAISVWRENGLVFAEAR